MANTAKQTFPCMGSLDAFVEYFDTHDLGEELESLPIVTFDVDIRARKHLVTLDEDIATQIEKIAIRQHIPSEVLINSWLRDKIAHVQVT